MPFLDPNIFGGYKLVNATIQNTVVIKIRKKIDENNFKSLLQEMSGDLSDNHVPAKKFYVKSDNYFHKLHRIFFSNQPQLII